jgi:hypothetical protein
MRSQQRTSSDQLHLGDRDPVQRDVELTVASPTQAMAFSVARPDRHGCAAVVAGKGRRRAEPCDPGGLAQSWALLGNPSQVAHPNRRPPSARRGWPQVINVDHLRDRDDGRSGGTGGKASEGR